MQLGEFKIGQTVYREPDLSGSSFADEDVFRSYVVIEVAEDELCLVPTRTTSFTTRGTPTGYATITVLLLDTEIADEFHLTQIEAIRSAIAMEKDYLNDCENALKALGSRLDGEEKPPPYSYRDGSLL